MAPLRRLTSSILDGATLTLGIGVVAGLTAYAYIVGTTPQRLSALQYTMDRWSAVALRDADQCFLGVIPGSREGLADFRDGRDRPADEKTILVTKVPGGFWDVAVALEHRSIGTWRTLPDLGIDIVSLGQALYDTASGHPRGASTLPQLVAGALLKTAHGSRENWIARKGVEIANGAALYSSYSLSDGAGPGFKNLVATYLPLAQSSQSGRAGVLYGLGVTGLVLFGKTPEALSLAEQAVLAAAIKSPILLAPDDDANGQLLAQRIFERIKLRAGYGLMQAYGAESAKARAALEQVKSMPLPRPHLCAALRPYLPADAGDAFRVAFNPAWRAQHFADEELSQIVSELKTIAGPNFRERVQAVRLTLREKENFPFKQAVRSELTALERKWDEQLSIGLVSGHDRPVGDILLAATGPAGRLRLFYQSPERPLFDIPRATGSVSKMIAAVSLAQAGSDSDFYCNLRIDGVLRNADGDTGRRSCMEPGAAITARESFARSLNLPIFHALNARSDRDLRGLATRAGFSPYPKTAARTALSFGLVSASPGDMLRLMTAVSKAAHGQSAYARSPRIIAAIAWRDPEQKRLLPERALDLSPFLSGEAASRFAESVLAAPLERGGTAASLAACTDSASWDLAKTGTVAQQGHVNSKLLLASGRYRDQPFAMIGLIGTVADNGNVGPVTTATLARVMCKGIEEPQRMLEAARSASIAPDGAAPAPPRG